MNATVVLGMGLRGSESCGIEGGGRCWDSKERHQEAASRLKRRFTELPAGKRRKGVPYERITCTEGKAEKKKVQERLSLFQEVEISQRDDAKNTNCRIKATISYQKLTSQGVS